MTNNKQDKKLKTKKRIGCACCSFLLLQLLVVLILIACLFIRCSKDVKVRAMYDRFSSRPVASANVTIKHIEHQLFKDGQFFYTHDHIVRGVTDEDGYVTFPDQPYGVFDKLFYSNRGLYIKATKGQKYGESDYHFYDHGPETPFYVYLNHEKAIKERNMIVVLNYCHGSVGKMVMSTSSLRQHGFTVKEIPTVEDVNVDTLRAALRGYNCQFWIISDTNPHMSQELYNLVYDHFNRGKGVFIWSDNDPFYADSNVMLAHLFGSNMSGSYWGQQTLDKQVGDARLGIVEHPITRNIDHLYEGNTISHVEMTRQLKPLLYSTDGNVVTAYYDDGKKRALIDGGFTRLYNDYWTEDTERFVVNCAMWLGFRE